MNMSILLNKSSSKIFGLDPTKQAALEVRRVFEVILPPSRLQIGFFITKGGQNISKNFLAMVKLECRSKLQQKAQAKKEFSKTQAK